jgi:hypothetical protein
MVADNKIAELSETDMEMVKLDLDNFPELDINFLGINEFPITKLNEIENTSEELLESDFQKFDNECPKCGFEWNNA